MSSILYQVVTNSKEVLNQFDLLKIEATLYNSKGVPISRRYLGNLPVILNSVFSKCNEGFEEEIIN